MGTGSEIALLWDAVKNHLSCTDPEGIFFSGPVHEDKELPKGQQEKEEPEREMYSDVNGKMEASKTTYYIRKGNNNMKTLSVDKMKKISGGVGVEAVCAVAATFMGAFQFGYWLGDRVIMGRR